MLGLILAPSITLANDDLKRSDIPVPTLYDGPVPTLISTKKLIKEPRLINAVPTLYNTKYQVSSAKDAFRMMQGLGLGITGKDYKRFNKNVPSRLDGKILLNVEDKGRAYIADYKNNKLIYLGNPDNAFKVLRSYLSSSDGSDPRNNTYTITGEEFRLVDGKFEKQIVPGSASKIVVEVFDDMTRGDINNDGLDDAVVILRQETGGSGTFYYVAIAMNSINGYSGTSAIFIGDRIAPQTTEIRDGKIIVNYADRKPWESFSERPSVGKSKYLSYKNGILAEEERPEISQSEAESLVIKNWGDSDELSVKVLDGKDGVWYVEAVYNNMKDDSVSAKRAIASVHYVDNGWKWGSEQLVEYKCQSGRGQSEFSEELCK